MTVMKNWPRGLRTLFWAAVAIGLALALVQRWLMWRALESASPARRWASLATWHLGMLRASYYPAAGQRFVPWIQWASLLGLILLCGVAVVFLQWARRSTSGSRVRAG